MMKAEIYLTLIQAAERLKVSERTLWSLAKTNEIPCFRVGKQYRFRESALTEWAKERESSPS